MGGGDELNSIVDILKCDIKCFRVGDIMTAEKKSGLLPRIVGGAKQRAEGMVRVPYFPDFQDNPSLQPLNCSWRFSQNSFRSILQRWKSTLNSVDFVTSCTTTLGSPL